MGLVERNMLDETPQTTPTVREARNRRFSSAVRLTMMLRVPRTASGGAFENKELSQEEHIEVRALAARYASHFSSLHLVLQSLACSQLRLSP